MKGHINLRFKAIFFDRDDTLVFNDREWEKLRNEKLYEWSGREFIFSHDLFTKIFKKVRNGGFAFSLYKNIGQELAFFRQWYLYLFAELGITENIHERADFLTERLWYFKKELYPETLEVLEYFKNRGYKMGVISDCPPSLEQILINCGLAKYFTSFTASSLVGAGKPNPIIYKAALNAQQVTACESLYVDDMENEADGARQLGFTAFHLVRTEQPNSKQWSIKSLKDIITYVEQN